MSVQIRQQRHGGATHSEQDTSPAQNIDTFIQTLIIYIESFKSHVYSYSIMHWAAQSGIIIMMRHSLTGKLGNDKDN